MKLAHFRLDVGKEDRIIRGEVRIPAETGSYPVILICHGFKAFKEWGFFPTLADRLTNSGFATILFDFSMNGVGDDPSVYGELDKFARLTFSREQEDLALLLKQIQKGALPYAEFLDPQRIGIIGHSRGGGNSLIFALDHPEDIQSVVIWNSISRPDFFTEETIKELKEKGITYIQNARTKQSMPIHREVLDDIDQNRERFDFLHRLPYLTSPLLIVQADHDHPGFMEGARKMAKLAPQATLQIIRNANHTMGAVHPFAGITPQLEEAMKRSADFFKRHLY